MEQLNRRSALTLGAAALAGVVTLPMTAPKASAEEHRFRHIKLHEAALALRVARHEIETSAHNWGGEKERAIEAIDRALVHLEKLRDFE